MNAVITIVRQKLSSATSAKIRRLRALAFCAAFPAASLISGILVVPLPLLCPAAETAGYGAVIFRL